MQTFINAKPVLIYTAAGVVTTANAGQNIANPTPVHIYCQAANGQPGECNFSGGGGNTGTGINGATAPNSANVLGTNSSGQLVDDTNAVAITGGTIDGTILGQTTPAAGSFTSLASSSYSLTYTGSAGATPFTVFGPNLGTGNQICQGFGTAASSGNATYYCWYHTGTNTGYGSLETFGGSSPIRVNASNWRVDTAGNVTANAYHAALYTPASSSAACSAGDFADDTNFHYVCVAASTWKRVALAPF